MISVEKLAGMIDHTNAKAFASDADMSKLCDEAVKYGFAMVAINSGQTKRCAKYLKGKDIHVGAAVSFPLGQTTVEVKVFETKNAIANGAHEIDYVVNLTELKDKNYSYIEEEMRQIVDICNQNGVISKVIFENCYLTKEEIVELAKIARRVRPTFIKTSTGFGTGGADLNDVKLMKSVVGNDVKVKASGGIRTIEDVLAFLDAGCERIGTSASVKIIEDYKKILESNKKL